MKVKAKWAVKVNGVWRKTGDVFETDSADGLLGAVEVLEDKPKTSQVKKEEVVPEQEEPKPDTEAKAEPKPRTAARTRRKATEK